MSMTTEKDVNFRNVKTDEFLFLRPCEIGNWMICLVGHFFRFTAGNIEFADRCLGMRRVDTYESRLQFRKFAFEMPTTYKTFFQSNF